jgi:N2-acetyl-L-2,4-diaminobutanoate deacetylase
MSNSMMPSPILCTFDLDEKGVHHGFLRLPYSRDDSAWGSVMIPISVFNSGAGPTALVTGANHGDEYEGSVALFDLARTLDIREVSGRVVIVPGMNYPAFQAGTRTSPFDKGNLNRLFPGRPNGTVTEKIADYFQRVLLPKVDVVLDCHSGGKTLDFIPFCASHVLPDKKQEAEGFRLVEAFGGPYSVKMLEIDSMGMFDTAAEEMGKVFLTGECGGGGTTTYSTVRRAKRGIRNFLIAAGALRGTPELTETKWLDMPDGDCFMFAENAGLIEFCFDLGSHIRKGDTVARIWSIDRTGQTPAEVMARRGGLFMGRHFPGLVKMGDCIAMVADVL